MSHMPVIAALVGLAATLPSGSRDPARTGQAAAPVVRTADPAARGLSETDFPRVQRLAAGVYSYEQLRSAGAERFTTVSLFVVTAEGVLVADGQGSVAETTRLIDEIARVTPQPIRHVVVASDHGDHTAGNAAFPATATFHVHPTSRNVLAAAALPGPVSLVEDHTTLRLGGTEMQLLFLGRAHTGGDLSVYLPREKILFMSEAYLNRVFPAMRSAFPSEWVATIGRAQALDVEVYVPGHGFVESPAVLEEELARFKLALEQVIAEARRLHGVGLDIEAAIAQARFGDLDTWSLRASQAAVAVRRVYLEIEGKLPR